jgi:CHAT domain-containing protein
MDLLAEGRLTAEVPQDLLERRNNVQRKIDLLAVRLSTAPPEQAAALRSQVESLVSADDETEARIRQSLSETKLSKPLESISELQSHLPADSALLEYSLGEREGFLWLVRADGIRLFRLPSRTAIESQCAPVLRLFPEILERKRSPETQRQFDRAMHQLSATLLGPLQGVRLPARVIIVPDGVLTRIPFAALIQTGNLRFGLEHDLLQAPSAAYLEAGLKPRGVKEFPKAFLGLADPVYSLTDPRLNIQSKIAAVQPVSDLARLPFNAELDTVATLVPASQRRFLLGFEANADAVKNAPLWSYAVLHLSAHALIDDRVPEVSRIVLSMFAPSGRAVDGFLRPYQLSQLRLNGSTVVLSACDTALGKQVIGEGLAGFTTSLFSAGAAQLVLTLSPIDAEASSDFLGRTYRSVFGARPVAMEHAITLARRALARSERWSDPYYWASFAVYGRPAD